VLSRVTVDTTHPGVVGPSSLFREHRALRWLVPACVAGVSALAAGGVLTAQATPEPLPATTPTALLADVQRANVPGLSGTIVTNLSLGLPELPALGGDSDQASVASLLSGSHTMRFWYGGPDRQRIALLGTTDETDVFHRGRDVWQWDSDDHVATHTVLPAGQPARPAPEPTHALTPEQLARRALAAIDPSTAVTVAHDRHIADRSAYELVLTPRTSATRVGSVRIAVDGSTKMPLGVQVFARGASSPAIDVSYSHVTFKTPSDSNFRFTPPPGATVRRGMAAHESSPATPQRFGPGTVATIGSGWTAIAEYRTKAGTLGKLGGPILGQLSPVQGAWGSGKLLESTLVSVLVTDDGRVFAGAVEPSALYAAATAHK
jgi:outer membrane lipoprotein-sorting protein